MGKGAPNPLKPVWEGPQRATFLELFFDLVFVFALIRISTRAFEDLALEPGGTEGWAPVTGGGKTLLLLLALWTVWQGTAWTASRYDPYQIWIQTIMIIALGAVMVMGVAISQAFSGTGLAFALAYVTAQVSRPLILMINLRRDVRQLLKLRMLIVFSTTGAMWITGAMLSTNPRVVLWAIALGTEYTATRIGWAVPWLGRSIISGWDIGRAHLAERYQQFLLITLGETILVAGFTYSAGEFWPGRSATFAVALVTSILLWRLYFQRAGQILAEAVAKARHPATIGRSLADTHTLMVTGITAIAIGYELAIEHPFDSPEPAWIVMILGGPVLFLAGRARLEYEVFARVSMSRLIAIFTLVVLFPLLLNTTPLASAVAAAAVLAAVAVIDARRAWGLPPEEAAPPF